MPVLPVINLGTIAIQSICPNTEFNIPFTVANIPFDEDNIFYAVLNAQNSVVLGSVAGSAMGNYNITGIIPLSVPQGNYTIKVVGYHQGVNVNSNNSNSITVNLIPTIFSLGGGGSYCEGSDGIPLSISGSQVGIDYQLYRTAHNETVPVGIQIPGTGFELGMGVQTENGNYFVIGSSNNTCMNVMADTVSITVNPLPQKFNVTGGGNICAGSNGVNIGLDGSKMGFSYQLMLNDEYIGIPKAGTGTPFYFSGLFSADGRYTVVAINAVTNCSVLMNGYADVFAHPAPKNIHVSGGGTICEGAQGVAINLDSSETGIIYKLYRQGVYLQGNDIVGNGEAITFGEFELPGLYSVSAENAGCLLYLDNYITIYNLPTPAQFVVSSPSNGHYCNTSTEGVTIALNDSELGIEYKVYYEGSYLTSFAGTGLPLSYTGILPAGLYTVTAANQNSTCTTEMLGSVNVCD